MKLKYRAPLIAIAVTALVSTVNAYLSYQTELEAIETARQNQLQQVARLVNAGIETQSQLLLSVAQTIISISSIEQLFQQREREQLLQELLPTYELLSQRYGVTIGQFHTPENISFLRLHQSDRFGDDLSFREMVNLANSRQSTYAGIEIGRGGVAIRGIVPVSDGDRPLGSFELGRSFLPILNRLSNLYDLEVAAFVDNQFFQNTTFDPDREVTLIGNYREIGSTNWPLLEPIISSEFVKGINDTLYRVQTIEGTDYGIVSIPMSDFSGRKIGTIVAVRNFSNFQELSRQFFLMAIAQTIVQIVLISGAILLVFNGFLLRPLLAIDEQLKKLASGQMIEDENNLCNRQDEIGEIARHCQKLQQKLAPQTIKIEKNNETESI
ncbi:MAG: cache domain-containing protein [Cyanobacteria bacterium P01_E01_bin.42]